MPTLSVVSTVYRYHCGTLAKVALYKLCFKLLRNCAHILRSILRNSKQDNNFVRFLMATFLPVISFYEKYLKYITKDLFVMVAMYGLEYLTASRKDFLMVKFRPNREAQQILPWVTFIMFSLKASISLLMATAVYFYCWFFSVSPL